MAFWLVVGPPDNWTFCFDNGNIWGFSPRYRKSWESLAEGDTVLCYATSPVVGVIGHCTVRSKQEDRSLFFPQEERDKAAHWPLRVCMAPTWVIPRDRWVDCRIRVERQGVTLQRALQRLSDERAKSIIQELDRVQ